MSWDNKYYESKKSEKHVWEQIVTWHKMFFWMGWDVVSESILKRHLNRELNEGGGEQTIGLHAGRAYKSARTLNCKGPSIEACLGCLRSAWSEVCEGGRVVGSGSRRQAGHMLFVGHGGDVFINRFILRLLFYILALMWWC